MELGGRYEIQFLEIGTDDNHVHFLIQTIPHRSVSAMVTIIKVLLQNKYSNYTPKLKNFSGEGTYGHQDTTLIL